MKDGSATEEKKMPKIAQALTDSRKQVANIIDT